MLVNPLSGGGGRCQLLLLMRAPTFMSSGPKRAMLCWFNSSPNLWSLSHGSLNSITCFPSFSLDWKWLKTLCLSISNTSREQKLLSLFRPPKKRHPWAYFQWSIQSTRICFHPWGQLWVWLKQHHSIPLEKADPAHRFLHFNKPFSNLLEWQQLYQLFPSTRNFSLIALFDYWLLKGIS